MTELENQGASGTKRLVLGFDAGCLACSELARRIEEQVGEKLEIRSLRNPQVREWRERALGDDAPWAPTLIEVKEPTEVRAWTGRSMALPLGRLLGPARTWRVMQVIGEMGAASVSERLGDGPAGALARTVNRRQFLKGVGGAVGGAAILTGIGWVPLVSNGVSPAQAQTRNQAPQEQAQAASDPEPLTGDELVSAARKKARRRDVVNLMGEKWSKGMQTGKVIQKRTRNGDELWFICYDSSKGCRSPKQDRRGNLILTEGVALIYAIEPELKNGNDIMSVSYSMSDKRTLAYLEYDESEQGIDSNAMLWRVKGGKVSVEKSSTNGQAGVNVQVSKESNQQVPTAAPDSASGVSDVSTQQYPAPILEGPTWEVGPYPDPSHPIYSYCDTYQSSDATDSGYLLWAYTFAGENCGPDGSDAHQLYAYYNPLNNIGFPLLIYQGIFVVDCTDEGHC